jgi:hypothetical protein
VFTSADDFARELAALDEHPAPHVDPPSDDRAP